MDEIVACMGEYIRNQFIERSNSNNNQDLQNFILVGHSQGGAAVSQVYLIYYSLQTNLFSLLFYLFCSYVEVIKQLLVQILKEL